MTKEEVIEWLSNNKKYIPEIIETLGTRYQLPGYDENFKKNTSVILANKKKELAEIELEIKRNQEILDSISNNQ